MSRTSRVSYFQNVFDLFNVQGEEHLPEAAAMIWDWERRTGRPFPQAMKEFYTTAVLLRTSGSEPQDWNLTLLDLWSEFGNDERAQSLKEVLEHRDLPIRLENIHGEVKPGPYCLVMCENQGVWLMEVCLGVSDDPYVYADEWTFLDRPGPDVDVQDIDHPWWHPVGRFTEVVVSWLAFYYTEDFTPISYQHRSWQTGLKPENAPPKPYINGLWLRSPAEPFIPPILDYLTENLSEPDRLARPGDVTTYTFRPDGGTVRVTADDLAHPEALSAWWIHAETPERLAELGRPLLPWGTLRETLRADTDPAREVLRSIS